MSLFYKDKQTQILKRKTRTVLFFERELFCSTKRELFCVPTKLTAHKLCISIGSNLYCMKDKNEKDNIEN